MMRLIQWIFVCGFVLCLHQTTHAKRNVGVTNLIHRLIQQYRKLKRYEGDNNLSTRKRSYVSAILKSIIQDERVRYKKLKKNKKAKVAKDKQFESDLRDKISSAVESITFTAPQLKNARKSELDRLLERMKEKTIEDQQVHQRSSELRFKKKAVVNDSFSDVPAYEEKKIAKKTSANPHPVKIMSVYQQAHEGNNTDDDEIEENVARVLHADHTINPNPHPDPIKASHDPLRVSKLPITNEVDEDNVETTKDKPKGNEKDRSERPTGVDYKPGTPDNKNMSNNISKSDNKTAKVLKPPDNWSLAVNKEEKFADPALKILNATSQGNTTQPKNETKSKLHKSSKMITPIQEPDNDNYNDNWSDRRTHALAVLAKLSSDLDQPEVVDNVMQALGISDILKQDRPFVVQHNEIEASPDVFDRDTNWVDEELGGSSGSGDQYFSKHRNKNTVHQVHVLKEAFFPQQKGKQKDILQVQQKHGLGEEIGEFGNLVND